MDAEDDGPQSLIAAMRARRIPKGLKKSLNDYLVKAYGFAARKTREFCGGLRRDLSVFLDRGHVGRLLPRKNRRSQVVTYPLPVLLPLDW